MCMAEAHADTITPNPHGDFYTNIGKHAESNHGYTPKSTNDAKEANELPENRSKDIGYGHKIKKSERDSKTIHGVPYIDEHDNYITLKDDDLDHFLEEDMKAERDLARKTSWDKTLKEKGSSWDKLDQGFRHVLTSLAYNTGGTVAGEQWKGIFDAAIKKDVKAFAAHARRNDNGKKTAGMDNRVLKELYYANLIKDASEVSSVLPLANPDHAGVPRGKPKTSREEFEAAFKAAKQEGRKIFEWPKGSGKKYTTKEA